MNRDYKILSGYDVYQLEYQVKSLMQNDYENTNGTWLALGAPFHQNGNFYQAMQKN